MKICKNCGIEISTKDGDNYCQDCDSASPKKLAANRRKNSRKERESIMRDLGLTKVRGVLGGTYWE